MPTGLTRRQNRGDFHFITFSCYHRRPYLLAPASRDLFERSLETMRTRHHFVVAGYVVMPEHVHLLLSEPRQTKLATALQAIKLSVSIQSRERPFWQARYFDFNVFTPDKRTEKLRYMHRNPVRRGPVEKPEDWAWSSYRHYASGEQRIVEIESDWTAARRNRVHQPGCPTSDYPESGCPTSRI